MQTQLRRAAAAAAREIESAPGSVGPSSNPADSIASASENDPLLSQAQVRQLIGSISAMTLWRWRRAGILPPPIVIRGRNYNRRSDILSALQAAAEPTKGDAE